MGEEKQNLKKILQEAKLKSTAPRLSVLKVLSEIKKPGTAQEIHRRLKKIDLVTLYRTLASFEKRGLVKHVDLHKDAVYYELNIGHHHHIVCTNCETVEDFENSKIEKILEQVSKNSSKFRNIKEHSIEFFGVCKICS